MKTNDQPPMNFLNPLVSPSLPILNILCACYLVLHGASNAQALLPFQGRLADAAGKPIADGVRLIQFQIYSEPSGGSLLWAGELHRATVNGGLVNVMLGSKNPLPRDRADQPDKSFFDQPLYLQITVAKDGNQIDAADAPLLPRQTVLPGLFAQESTVSRNSQKLAGYDWSALFGTNNPSGKIDGSRVANITSNSIAPQTMNGSLIAPLALTSNQIAADTIGLEKLRPRRLQTNAAAGDIAVSTAVSWQSSSSAGGVVPNLSASLETTGRPVLVFLTGSGSGAESFIGSGSTPQGGFEGGIRCQIQRSGPSGTIPISLDFPFLYNGLNGYVNIRFAPGSFQVLDLPPRGNHTYTVSVFPVGPSTDVRAEIRNVRLVAFEL